MKNLNIPIYRGLKLGSENEYVEGYFSISPSLGNSLIRETIYYGANRNEPLGGATDIIHQIDPATLSIHFPDMIDSKGNKIFASLSEDGKGGDVLSDGMQYEFTAIMLAGGVVVLRTEDERSKASYENDKVIGLQQ